MAKCVRCGNELTTADTDNMLCSECIRKSFNHTAEQFIHYVPCQQGWVCPKCGRVYSPSTAMCFYCGGLVFATTSNAVIQGEGHD